MFTGFAVRQVTGRAMDYNNSSCSMSDQLSSSLHPTPASGPDDVKDALHQPVVLDVDTDSSQTTGPTNDTINTINPATADEASIIDEYFRRLHDVTATTSGCDVIADAHWLAGSTTTPTTSQQQPRLLFTSGGDEIARNRKYYESFDGFVDLGGAYVTSGCTEARPPPPPSYQLPLKREDTGDEEVVIRASSENGGGNASRLDKLYTGSCYSATSPPEAAYFAQYGAAGAFPVLIDQGQYGGVATAGGVLGDVRGGQYYLPTTGNGNSCAAGYLSVDVGGFGPTMLRTVDFQSSCTAAWPTAFRQ